MGRGFAVAAAEAKVIANLLVNEIMTRHGAPHVFLSDREQNFLSSLVKEVCYLLNTNTAHTSAYHPQCNGLLERSHATLAQTLSMYAS